MNSDTSFDDLPEEVKEAFFKLMAGFDAAQRGELKECVRCGKPITELEQVGRCIYANPCGCRQFQGFLPRK